MNFKILNIINTLAKKLRFFTSFKFLAFSSVLGVFGILTFIFPEIAQAANGFWDAITEGAVSVVSWIIGGIINFIIVYIEVPLLKKVLDITAGVLANTDVMNSPLITGPWSTIRDITNIAFIGILIVISLMNIIGIGADRYSIQAAMPKFIFAVVAVNFSKLFCTVILDLFNVVSASLYNLLMGETLGKYGEGLPKYLNNFYKFNNEPNQYWYNNLEYNNLEGTMNTGLSNNATVDITSFSVDQVVIAVVLGILIMGFMGLTFTFLVRMVWLWILTVTSPIYFLGMSVSIFGSLQKMWWDKFLKYALIPVKVAAILSVGLLIHNNLMQEMSNTNSSPTSFSGLWRTFWHPEDINNVVLSESSFIIGSLIVAGVCYAAFKAAHDDGIADSVNGWFKNKFPKMALGVTDKAMRFGSKASDAIGQSRIPVLNSLGKKMTKVFDAPYKAASSWSQYQGLLNKERDDRVKMGGSAITQAWTKLGSGKQGLLFLKSQGDYRGKAHHTIDEGAKELASLSTNERVGIAMEAYEKGDKIMFAKAIMSLAKGGDLDRGKIVHVDGKDQKLMDWLKGDKSSGMLDMLMGHHFYEHLDDEHRRAIHDLESRGERMFLGHRREDKIANFMEAIHEGQLSKASGMFKQLAKTTKDPYLMHALVEKIMHHMDTDKDFENQINYGEFGQQLIGDLSHAVGANSLIVKYLNKKFTPGDLNSSDPKQQNPENFKDLREAIHEFDHLAGVSDLSEKERIEKWGLYLAGGPIVVKGKVHQVKAGSKSKEISDFMINLGKSEGLKSSHDVENIMVPYNIKNDLFERGADGGFRWTIKDIAASGRMIIDEAEEVKKITASTSAEYQAAQDKISEIQELFKKSIERVNSDHDAEDIKGKLNADVIRHLGVIFDNDRSKKPNDKGYKLTDIF